MISFDPPKSGKPPVPLVDKKVFLSDDEWDRMARYLVGSQQRFRENIIIPTMLTPPRIKTNEEKAIESAMESCAFKSIMACVLGKIFKNFNIQNFCSIGVTTLGFRIWSWSCDRPVLFQRQSECSCR